MLAKRANTIDKRLPYDQRHGVWVPAFAGTTPCDGVATCKSPRHCEERSDEAIQFFLVVFSIASLATKETQAAITLPYTFSPPSRMKE